MEPFKPMKPMSPMPKMEQWWSDGLGDPSASGSQDGMRYAFFPDKKLLLIERDGKLQTFDTGQHRIAGVSQISRGEVPVFRSQHGPVKLDDLKKVS
jgi:hypothetical protein